MTGLGALAVGLVLCVVGTRSVQLVVVTSGFALGWLLTEALGGDVVIVTVVALAAAVLSWVVAKLIMKAALFVVGGIAGGVVGAKLFGLLQGDDGSWLLAAVFVVALAVVAGLATALGQQRILVVASALAGAGLAVNGAARAFPDALGFLRFPDTPAQAVLATASWVALALLGWSVQRRQAQGERRVEA